MSDYVPLNFSLPADWRKPGFYGEFDLLGGMASHPLLVERRVYVLAQKLASASAVENAINRIFNEGDAATLLGRGSEAFIACMAAMRAAEYVELLAVAVPAAAGAVAASGTMTFGGTTATKEVQAVARIGAIWITFGIAVGDTTDDVAASFVAAIAARPNLPLTGAAVDSVVTGTLKYKGLTGNDLTWEIDTGDEITATPTAFTNGAGENDLTNTYLAIANPGNKLNPTHIVIGSETLSEVQDLRDHCEDQEGPLKMRYRDGFSAFTGTLSAGCTLAAGVDSWRGNVAAFVGSGWLPIEIAAAYAATIASEPDPARPRQDMVVKGLTPPLDPADIWEDDEANVLINNGLAPLGVNSRGEVYIIREATTRTTDGQGNPDLTGADHTTPDTASNSMKDMKAFLMGRYRRQKKTTGVHARIKEDTISRFQVQERIGWVYNLDSWKAGIVVQDDPADPTAIEIGADVTLVSGLRLFKFKMKIHI